MRFSYIDQYGVSLALKSFSETLIVLYTSSDGFRAIATGRKAIIERKGRKRRNDLQDVQIFRFAYRDIDWSSKIISLYFLKDDAIFL